MWQQTGMGLRTIWANVFLSLQILIDAKFTPNKQGKENMSQSTFNVKTVELKGT